MASKKEKDKSKNTQNNLISETSFNPTDSGGSDSDNTDSSAQKTSTHTINKQKHTIVVNIIQQKEENVEVVESKSSWWSVIINAGLFVCTLILAGISFWQGYLTRRAVDIADSTFKVTRDYNQKTFDIQQKAYDKSIRDAKTQDSLNDIASNRQKRSVEAQIASLQETKKQIELSNRPFLQITNLDIDSNFNVSYHIYNSGNQPLQIISGGQKVGFFANPNLRDFGNYNYGSNSIINTIIANKSYINIPTTGKPTGIDSIKTGKKFIYIIGEFGYKSLVEKNKNYYYKFEI